jgi:hypothetical protein
MATNKTPADKRIRRAEQGREDWKIKAQLRREENVKLMHKLEKMKLSLSKLEEEKQKVKDQLASLQKKCEEQDEVIEKLKKKSSRQ